MSENLPPEFALIVSAVLTIAAVYRLWIAPGYDRDRKIDSKRRK